jgi:hypothetical protein
LGYLLVEKKG